MRLVAGIGELNLPALFASAQRRIVLHAAIYGPFADSAPHRDSLKTALGRASFERLDIISIDEAQPWSESFWKALRFGVSAQERSEALRASSIFLGTLKETNPEKVFIHAQSSIPCQPIIIIDDTIVFGQYAHSDAYAAKGFWGIVETDVEKLFHWAATGLPKEAPDGDIAAYRLVCECHHAMKGGRE